MGLASDAVGINKREFAFVIGGGFQIKDAACEAFRDNVGHTFTIAEHALTADAEQWKRRTPRGSAYFAEADFDRGVAIGVTFNEPFKSKVEKGGMFNVEAAGLTGILGLS